MVIPPPRVFPKCPKCEGQNFSTQTTTYNKIPAIIIYCGSCGSVLGIINAKDKDKTT